eukprot:7037530-Alexandrium_andersonii.AAC.1
MTGSPGHQPGHLWGCALAQQAPWGAACHPPGRPRGHPRDCSGSHPRGRSGGSEGGCDVAGPATSGA